MIGRRAHAGRSVFVRNKWAARLALLAALIIATLVKTDAAAPGVIDTTFGRDGTGRVLSTFVAEGNAIALDRLGNIVVAGTQKVNGHSQIVVARYDPTGITLDLTFGNFGIGVGSIGALNRDNVAVAVAIDDANRVIVGGTTTGSDINSADFLIGRYTAQGVLDVNFNPATPFGWRSYDIGGRDLARGMAVDSQGRIILVGSRFGDQEQQTFCHILGLCIPGDDIVALRVLLNGDPDNSFDDDGKVAIDLHDFDEATNVAIDQQDRVVIVGANLDSDNPDSIAQARIVRFNVDGSRDDSFGIRGTKSFTFNGRNFNSASAVAIDRFGRIVVAGVAADGSSSGTFFPLDHNFNGSADFALARVNDDGTLDATFGDGGIAPFVDVAGFDDLPRAIAIDAFDRILVGGSTASPATNLDFAIARYNTDGSVDTHYGVNGVAQTDFIKDNVSGSDQVRGMVFDSQGRTIAGGVSFMSVDQPFLALARYVADRPDFSISTVASVPVLVDGSASTTITVNSIDGLNSPVTLTVTGTDGGPLPAGFTASFDGGGAEIQVTPPPFGTIDAHLNVTAGAGVMPGTYTFTVSPQPDSPDHAHAVSFAITVNASPAAVTDVIAAFQAAGAIDNSGIANALATKLADAKNATDAGDTKRAANSLDALINQIHAQTGKHIASTATIDGVTIQPPDVLLADVRDLLAALRTTSVQNPIMGYVTTAANGEVGNASLSLLDTAGAVVATATTDSTGFYYFPGTNALVSGSAYSVTVTGFPKGFTTASPATQTFTWLIVPVSLTPFTVSP